MYILGKVFLDESSAIASEHINKFVGLVSTTTHKSKHTRKNYFSMFIYVFDHVSYYFFLDNFISIYLRLWLIYLFIGNISESKVIVAICLI
jgi:hypothetical protein